MIAPQPGDQYTQQRVNAKRKHDVIMGNTLMSRISHGRRLLDATARLRRASRKLAYRVAARHRHCKDHTPSELGSSFHYSLQGQGVVWMQSHDLVSPLRFDICIKILYARLLLKDVSADWAQQLYLKHLRIWNGFYENAPLKNSPEDFLRAYRDIVNSLEAHGFQEAKSVIPVASCGTPSNGAHRIAASVVMNKRVACVHSGRHVDHGYYYFKNLDVNGDILQHEWDAAAFEYCRLRKDTRIALVFPVATGRQTSVRRLLAQECTIFYEKEIEIESAASVNLLRLAYKDERWIGGIGGTGNLYRKANRCFAKRGKVRMFVLSTTASIERLHQIKRDIRSLFGVGNDSIHITDTYDESYRIAEVLLNCNGVSQLRYVPRVVTPRFHQLMHRFVKWMDNANIDPHDICITGSAVLAAYGLRDCRDIDYLVNARPSIPCPRSFGDHEKELAWYPATKHEIIYDPLFHVWNHGVKFASLEVVSAMKRRRKEHKDVMDVQLIIS